MLQHPKELARQITLIDHGMNFDYRLVFQFVEFKGASASSSLCNRGFARQPCCMAGTMKMFSIGKNIFSHRKKNLLFLPFNMAAVQNLFKVFGISWIAWAGK